MNTLTIYYVILSVYILLLSCQLVTCHLTHSLIILTDSYINLYRILDISFGIIHLRTQQELFRKRTLAAPTVAASSNGNQTRALNNSGTTTTTTNDNKKLYPMSLAGRIFGCVCTYQFKRLPLLGSFINGLFLAALLMSAAIEGIQTCFHSNHSLGHDQKSILDENPLTYPLILVGFALVGLIMQQCSLKAHVMRDEELLSESLLDLSNNSTAANGRNNIGKFAHSTSGSQGVAPAAAAPARPIVVLKELNVNSLVSGQEMELADRSRTGQPMSNGSAKRRSYDLNVLQRSTSNGSAGRLNSNANSSLQELPTSLSDYNETRISLKSLKLCTNLDNIEQAIRGANSKDLEAPTSLLSCKKEEEEGGAAAAVKQLNERRKSSSSKDRCWFIVRYMASPVALITCASVVYFGHNELATEICDATLSVAVVTLLFAASYPPMKKAGKVLLQTAPDGVNLDKLEKELLTIDSSVMKIENLHVWSLTPRSNRVATCQLILNKSLVSTDKHIEHILSEAKYKFLDQNIKCTTIEPILKDHQELTAKPSSSSSSSSSSLLLS